MSRQPQGGRAGLPWLTRGLGLALLQLCAGPADAQAPAAAAPATAASASDTTVPDAKADDDGAFKWDFYWQDWQGLSFYATQPTKVQKTFEAAPLINLAELSLAGSIGGRLELDGAAFGTGGTLSGFNDGFEVRRARITAKGASILGVPFSYRVDLGYVPGEFTVTQAYIEVAGIQHLGDFQFGQFTPPVGLQMITSSWDIGFMEPAAPMQALAPGSQPGLQFHDTMFDRRGTWTLGAYAGVSSRGEYGSGAQSFGNVMGRLTWLALDTTDDKNPAANRYLHLGISANLQGSNNGSIRYRSRPESFIAPFVIDTGDIDADSARGADVEALWVDGPFSAQGEFIGSRVDANSGARLGFFGLYSQLSWYLTGESRPYNRSSGIPGRLVPRSNFGFGPDAGWGAFEAGARLSYTNLSDGPVHGGHLTMLMGSLNWYLRPQLKCMLELGTGRVGDNAKGNGNILLAQLRLGLYFY